MYQAIKYLHSYWAYLVVLVVIFATLNALYSFFTNKEYSYKDFRLSLFALIVTHLQFVNRACVVSLYLPWGFNLLQTMAWEWS